MNNARANNAFLIALWAGTIFYIYASAEARYFSGGVHTAAVLARQIPGVIMLAAPALLLSLSLWLAPRSVLVKISLVVVTIVAITLSFSSLTTGVSGQGALLFLHMVVSWIVALVTVVIAAIKVLIEVVDGSR